MKTVIKGINSKFYRGTANSSNYTRNKPTYFAPKKNDAKLYTRYKGSNVYAYKPTKKIKLLKMNDINTLKKVLNSRKISDNARNTIKTAFIIRDGKVYRHSKPSVNNKVTNIVATLGYDGYIINNMTKKNGNQRFHSEIAISRAVNKVKVVPKIIQTNATGMTTPKRMNSPNGSKRSSPINSRPSKRVRTPVKGRKLMF